MQENNFEDQVRRQMEELQFQPSEPVWQNVAAQIREKKRKRRLLLLLLPLLMLSGGLLWYYTKPDAPVNHPAVATHQEQSVNNQPLGTASRTEENTRAQQSSSDKQNSNTQKEKETFKRKQTIAANTIKRKKKHFELTTEHSKTDAAALSFENDDLHALVLQNEIEKKERGKNENVSQSETENSIVPPFAARLKNNSNDSVVVADSAASIVNTTKENTDSVVASLPAPALQQQKGRDKKWQWTVQARVGVSGLRTQMGDVFAQQYSADFAARPSTGNQAPTMQPVTAAIQNGVAFTVGAGLRKQMFKKAFVGAGLQYSRYSTSAPVGTRIAADTVMQYNGRMNNVSSYYRSGGTYRQYTTSYHYLEVPLAIEYPLFKLVQVQHGVSMGRLLSTNALYFDKAAQVWYRSDDWLRKTGFHVFTAIDYPLVQAKNFTLLAGPQLQWGLLPAQVKEEAKKHHLFFAGLGTRVHF